MTQIAVAATEDIHLEETSVGVLNSGPRTVTPNTPSPTSQLLTFEDLVALAEERKASAWAPEKIAGWDRLLSVAQELAGSGASDDDVARGRTWSLVRVRIHNYQGVGAEPLEIQFDPTPGVTVMHGSNGSGKSSIADAVERQVQLAKNLREFLEPLLAFGGCFETLKDEVTKASAPATEAMRRWKSALTDAQAAVAAVDQQWVQEGASGLAGPNIDDDPDQWLQTSELTEAGSSVPEVTEQHHDRLRVAAAGVIKALLDLEAAETSLPLASPVRSRTCTSAPRLWRILARPARCAPQPVSPGCLASPQQ